MDYNSQPWTYEVITINGDERNVCITTTIESDARAYYNKMFIHYPTVLFTQSRKGMVKGQYEL